MTTEKYTFVIDTNQYSGNFERELCAFVSGHVGDCGVGSEAAEQYLAQTKREPLPFIEQHRDDDDNCLRPCAIYLTPGWFNDGMGGHFLDGQEAEALIHYRAEVIKYAEQQIENVKHWNWPKQDEQEEIARRQQEISDVNNLKAVSKFPAYQSVAIFCSRNLTLEEIEFMKQRAIDFCTSEQWKHLSIAISGFRLVTESTTISSQIISL